MQQDNPDIRIKTLAQEIATKSVIIAEQNAYIEQLQSQLKEKEEDK